MNDESVKIEGDDVREISIEKFFQDLSKSLERSDNKARSLIQKIASGQGKPSKTVLAKTFDSLYSLIKTTSQIERVTVGHTQALVRSFSYQVRSMVRVLQEKGILSENELKEKTKEILEEDKEREFADTEERKKNILEDSIAQAQEESMKS